MSHSPQHDAVEDDATVMFGAVQDKIDFFQRQCHNLGLLLKQMDRNPDAFDNEDKELVQAHLAKHSDTLADLQQDLQRRQHLYTNTIQKMERALTVRTAIIEAVDGETSILEDNPELNDALVKKQTTLTQLLHKMKLQLNAPPLQEEAADDAL